MAGIEEEPGCEGVSVDYSQAGDAIRMPPPPRRKYRVPLFAGYDRIYAYWVDFLPDWVLFHTDADDHQKVIAYPTHYVRGAITELETT